MKKLLIRTRCFISAREECAFSVCIFAFRALRYSRAIVYLLSKTYYGPEIFFIFGKSFFAIFRNWVDQLKLSSFQSILRFIYNPLTHTFQERLSKKFFGISFPIFRARKIPKSEIRKNRIFEWLVL